MDITEQLKQLQNFNGLSISELTSWWKSVNSDLIQDAAKLGFKEDLASIALMMTTDSSCSFEHLVTVLHQMYIHRLHDTDYFNTVEKLRMELCNIKDKIVDKVMQCRFICVVCKENKVDTVFLMCGHLVVCRKCSKLTQCPECKSHIEEIVRIYYE